MKNMFRDLPASAEIPGGFANMLNTWAAGACHGLKQWQLRIVTPGWIVTRNWCITIKQTKIRNLLAHAWKRSVRMDSCCSANQPTVNAKTRIHGIPLGDAHWRHDMSQ